LDNFCAAPSCVGLQRPGGYADHLLVPHPRYLIDTADIDPVWAATLACSGLSAYSSVSKLNPIPIDEWVAVIGAGGLGLSAIAMLRVLGHERIIAIDVDSAKLEAAAQAGAAATVDGSAGDAGERIKRIAGGTLFGAVDLVGTAVTAELALGALRKGGKLILVGLFGGEISLSLVSTVQRALTIQGSHLGSVAELKQVVALARQGKLQPIPVQKRPLSEVSRILDELKAGSIRGRVVIEA
jgi:D-arabinose 1-dehydrogenase-like Zn-dependent alcohol dehydrogenase